MNCDLTCGSIFVVIGVVLYLLRRYAQGGQFTKNVRADGKVVIITGSNTGIGKETALELARKGARVYMACRSLERGEKAKKEIVAVTGNTNVFNLTLDLTSMESVRNFVKEFLKRETSLDILINNAGVFGLDRSITKDGHEIVLASNYLGHFLLTNLLLDILKSSAASRIVNVSSTLHRYGKIVRDDLHAEREYKVGQVYANSKLANMLFSRELAKRLDGSSVTSNSLHPGIISTEISRNYPTFSAMAPFVFYFFWKSVKSGCQTTLYCALDPELKGVTGKYFSDCRIADESNNAHDDDTAEWLWRASEKLTGLAE
ncbi:retinol dehydrogenase 11-like [Bradysia coprophila]|uniref:retinol dehydrogenase 11-like n=1 Tax=Bradysia coprophila TaxID=38358 RepID=UPI00187D8AAD|nr:retinol dehydrogenase 11-like [Bradysia coprophila]